MSIIRFEIQTNSWLSVVDILIGRYYQSQHMDFSKHNSHFHAQIHSNRALNLCVRRFFLLNLDTP